MNFRSVRSAGVY